MHRRLFFGGTPQAQLSSCFLIDMKEDSIYNTIKTCAMVSKISGAIGLNVHLIRATGSYIAGTNGTSNGLIPMLRIFNMRPDGESKRNLLSLFVQHEAHAGERKRPPIGLSR